MSIDYVVCKNCGEAFPDCGDFEYCECGETWCSSECADKDGVTSDADGQVTSCSYCRKEKFDDGKILKYILSKYGKSKEDVISEMISEKLKQED